MKTGGIVLVGGASSRMGLAKATLPFGPELMVQRVVRLLSAVVDPIVVVAAPRQQIPPLSPEVVIARDEREGRGPLEGLLAGLTALEGRADAAYATSCDVPLLVPAFVKRMIERLEHHQVAVPVEGAFHHPLAAVYRPGVAADIRRLLAAGRRRPVFLYETVDTCRVPVEELKQVDAGLQTLTNLNDPRDYLAALHAAGFEAPPEILARLKVD